MNNLITLADIPAEVFDRVMEYFGLRGENILGHGSFAVAFEQSPTRVFKVTIDEGDAQIAELLRNSPHPLAAKVFDVCSIRVGYYTWYGISIQKVRPIEQIHAFDELYHTKFANKFARNFALASLFGDPFFYLPISGTPIALVLVNRFRSATYTKDDVWGLIGFQFEDEQIRSRIHDISYPKLASSIPPQFLKELTELNPYLKERFSDEVSKEVIAIMNLVDVLVDVHIRFANERGVFIIDLYESNVGRTGRGETVVFDFGVSALKRRVSLLNC